MLLTFEEYEILEIKVRLMDQSIVIFIQINVDWRLIIDVTRNDVCAIKNVITKHFNNHLLGNWKVNHELFNSLHSE